MIKRFKVKKGAFYTLEATWMMGLAIVVLVSVILLTIRLYGETANDIESLDAAQINAVSEFRKVSVAKDIAERAKGRESE